MRVDPSFEVFVAQRSTTLVRIAYLLTGDRGHAEDLVQTALLRTARHWAKARDAPDAYVRRVLVNLSHDRIRSMFRRPRESPLPDEVDTWSVDAGYEQVTERRVVVRALAQLAPRQRQVVVLRYFEDLSVEQTAELLGFSTGTVKSYTSRALARLRELLADYHQTLEVPHAHG